MRRREARRTVEPRRLAAGQRQRSKYNCLGGGGARVPPGAPLTCSRPAAGLKGQAGDPGPARRRPRPARRPRSPLGGCPRKARECDCLRDRSRGLAFTCTSTMRSQHSAGSVYSHVRQSSRSL